MLVISATHRDHRELPLLAQPGIDFIFHDYASTSLEDLITARAAEDELVADPLPRSSEFSIWSKTARSPG
jgi:hypothetical protein